MPILLAGLIWAVGSSILLIGGLNRHPLLPGRTPYSASSQVSANNQVIGQHWADFRNAAFNYAETHKGLAAPSPCWSGAILNLTFAPPSSWGCRISISTIETIWVYGDIPAGSVSVAANALGNPVNVGVHTGSVIQPPNASNLGVGVPGTIPLSGPLGPEMVSVEQIS